MGSKSIIKFGRPSKYSSRMPRHVMVYTNKCLEKDEFPTIEGLAINLGVGTRTIYDWEKLHEDFLQTTERLRDAQRRLLISNGLNNKYNSRFAEFLLKAIHGVSDSKAVLKATQNNYLNISPELLADALKLTKEKEEAGESLSDEY